MPHALLPPLGIPFDTTLGLHQGCIRRKAASEAAPAAVRQEEVAKAVGGGYCRLQMPLRLALGVRETMAGRRLGALEGGGHPLLMHPWPTHLFICPPTPALPPSCRVFTGS